jgi:hypothetical protein
MVNGALIVHLILTVICSLLALASTALVIYRLNAYERARLNDAEEHAFRLMDEVRLLGGFLISFESNS